MIKSDMVITGDFRSLFNIDNGKLRSVMVLLIMSDSLLVIGEYDGEKRTKNLFASERSNRAFY